MSENLLFRESDIAVRMYRPQQLDVVTRHLGDIRMGLFAARDYLARKGWPTRPEDLATHDLVGFDRSDLIIRGMAEMGWDVKRDFFPVRTDNQTAYWELVRAGCGIGFCQRSVGLRDLKVAQVLPDLPIPVLPVWLTTHRALRHTPRVDRVWRHLQAALAKQVG